MINLLRDNFRALPDSSIEFAIQEGLRKVATYSNFFNDYLDVTCCKKIILHPLKGKLLRVDEVFYLYPNGEEVKIYSENYSLSLGTQVVLNLFNINCSFKKIRIYYRYVPNYCDIDIDILPFDTTPIRLFAESYLTGLDENRKGLASQLEKEAYYSLQLIKDNFNKRPLNVSICV